MTKLDHSSFEFLRRHIRTLFHIPYCNRFSTIKKIEKGCLEYIDRKMVPLLLDSTKIISMDFNWSIWIKPLKFSVRISITIPKCKFILAALDFWWKNAECVLHRGPSSIGQNFYIKVNLCLLFTATTIFERTKVFFACSYIFHHCSHLLGCLSATFYF